MPRICLQISTLQVTVIEKHRFILLEELRDERSNLAITRVSVFQ